MQKRTEKSLDQVLKEMKEEEVGSEEKFLIKTILIQNSLDTNRSRPEMISKVALNKNLNEFKIRNRRMASTMLSSCLSVVSMALYICKRYQPLNTQRVSYCMLVSRKEEDKRHLINSKGRLLEILTGEGKSCVIALVAATYALLGRAVDIVTSSPVLSQRDAEDMAGILFYAETQGRL